MCCKLLLIINLEEFPDLIHPVFIFLFRVPPSVLNDWGDANNVLAVTDEAEEEAASLTATVSTGAGACACASARVA
jgi:hypothetical protein